MDTKQKCDVHGTTLRHMKVPLNYGLPPHDEELWDARQKLFPNAKSYLIGGCIAGSSGYETEAMVCGQCRKVERAWKKKHPRPY